jgi:hypothetical protein
LKQKIALCAGVLAFGLAAPVGAPAQPVAPYYPGAANPGAAPALPPYEILTIVRSAGLEPLTRPVRSGPAYALRAFDRAGQEMRVVVDVHSGRILKVTPLVAQRYAAPVMPPVYGRPPGGAAAVPDGYGPSSRIAALPPDAPPPGYTPGAPAAIAPPPAAAQAPPLPRPRPKVAAGDAPAAAPAIIPRANPPPPADEQAE